MSETRELGLPGQALIDLVRAVVGNGSTIGIRATGFSMSPFIKDGDKVVLSALQDPSPRLGDLVAFRFPGSDRLGVHRVIGKNGEFYATRGDNCLEADDLVSRRDILGRVIRIERNGGQLLLGLGPERLVIALLSRSNLLTTLTGRLIQIIGILRRISRARASIPTCP